MPQGWHGNNRARSPSHRSGHNEVETSRSDRRCRIGPRARAFAIELNVRVFVSLSLM